MQDEQLWGLALRVGICCCHGGLGGDLCAAGRRVLLRTPRELDKDREAASESAAKKWDRYIRGTEPLRDEDTGEIRDVSSLEDIVRWAEDNPNLCALSPLTEEQWRHELP